MTGERSNDIMEIWGLFSRVTKNIKRMIKQETNNFPIKSFEIRIMGLLKDTRDAPINVIADELDVSGPWVTGVVVDMENKGYVIKRRSINDKRIVMVSITPKGRRIVEQGTTIFRSIIEGTLKDLSDEEISQMKTILEKIDRSAEEINSRRIDSSETFDGIKLTKKIKN